MPRRETVALISDGQEIKRQDTDAKNGEPYSEQSEENGRRAVQKPGDRCIFLFSFRAQGYPLKGAQHGVLRTRSDFQVSSSCLNA